MKNISERTNAMPYTYYDIGLNLFTKSFPHPEKIIEDAHVAGIQCILTGSEAEENELVNTGRRGSIRTAPTKRRRRTWRASRKY